MKNVLLIIFFAAVTGVVVWIAMGGLAKDKLPRDKPLASQANLEDQLTEIKMRRRKIADNIEYLEKDRDSTANALREMGVRTKADADNPEKQMALQNLKRLMRDIEELRKHLETCDSTIPRIEAVLKKMNQKQAADLLVLTEEDQIGLRALELEMNAELGIDEDDMFGEQEQGVEDLLKEANEESGIELELAPILD